MRGRQSLTINQVKEVAGRLDIPLCLFRLGGQGSEEELKADGLDEMQPIPLEMTCRDHKHSLTKEAGISPKYVDSRHMAAAMEDPQRYMDVSVVSGLRQQLVDAKRADGRLGAEHALPHVLGVLEVIFLHARDVKSDTRRDLLIVGADGAEFAGWLYRDLREANMAQYWLDRADEWALEAGDMSMQGYILLRRSQMAYEERDGVRTLTLAQAARYGPWNLPSRVLAEVVQQEARGEAMTGASFGCVQRRLDEARQVLSTTGDGSPLASACDDSTFMLRSASCSIEAGKPARAAEMFGEVLVGGRLSPRDDAYFRARRAVALALSGEPDEAAEQDLLAYQAATALNSRRTARELQRVSQALAPWGARPVPRELRSILNSRLRRSGE